jgi:hypothetical protein
LTIIDRHPKIHPRSTNPDDETVKYDPEQRKLKVKNGETSNRAMNYLPGNTQIIFLDVKISGAF